MRYEEAAVKAEISRKEAAKNFCPLTQDYCRETCVAYRDASPVEIGEHTGNYDIGKARCTAYMLVGPA